MKKSREWISLHFLILSPFPLHFLILSPFSHSQAGRLAQLVQPCDRTTLFLSFVFVTGVWRKNSRAQYSLQEVRKLCPQFLALARLVCLSFSDCPVWSTRPVGTGAMLLCFHFFTQAMCLCFLVCLYLPCVSFFMPGTPKWVVLWVCVCDALLHVAINGDHFCPF